MIACYDPKNGNILFSYLNADKYTPAAKNHSHLDQFEIDEIDENQNIITELLSHQNKRDSSGNTKFYVLNETLHSRDNWVSDIEG